MNAIAKYFNDSKDINILVYGKKLLKNIMQQGIKLVIKKINSKPVYKDKYIKTKVNLYNTLF